MGGASQPQSYKTNNSQLVFYSIGVIEKKHFFVSQELKDLFFASPLEVIW
jgi:hypothetical protein